MTTTAAGVVALVMLLIEIEVRSPILLFGWVGSGIVVAWRSLLSVPSALRRTEPTRARNMLLLPAILNIILLGVIPGIIMLVAYFRSDPQSLRS